MNLNEYMRGVGQLILGASQAREAFNYALALHRLSMAAKRCAYAGLVLDDLEPGAVAASAVLECREMLSAVIVDIRIMKAMTETQAVLVATARFPAGEVAQC